MKDELYFQILLSFLQQLDRTVGYKETKIFFCLFQPTFFKTEASQIVEVLFVEP